MNQSGRIWEEALLVYLETVSWNLPGETEEIHEKPYVRTAILINV
jgi:hypothetical protein